LALSKKEELEKYRQLMDETFRNLRKIYDAKYKEIDPIMAIVGIVTLAMGGVVVVYSGFTDVLMHERITVWGMAGIFVGFSVCFLGYIVAHKGLTRCWL
jgi:hypothetical protein